MVLYAFSLKKAGPKEDVLEAIISWEIACHLRPLDHHGPNKKYNRSKYLL